MKIRMICPLRKFRGFLFCVFLCLVSFHVNAAWQVSQPESSIPREPFFQAGTQQKTAFAPSAYSARVFPNQYARLGQSAPVYAISISGSLKENLERIMGRYHWRVVWKAPFDYNFDGRITGSSLPNVVDKLLRPFPLRAVMYMSNRTLMITSKGP